jgi:hypothetical protein
MYEWMFLLRAEIVLLTPINEIHTSQQKYFFGDFKKSYRHYHYLAYYPG